MADRYYSNTDEGQRFQPGTTAEAGQVDQKFDEVTAGFQSVASDIDRSLKLPSASDTSQELDATPLQRRRMVVGFDADGNLTLLQGFGWRGDWTTATEYFVNDVFRDPATKNLYVTITRHTSAAALSNDITAGRVELAISVEEIEQFKNDAQAARDKAKKWAEEVEDTEVEAGQFSAKHHASKSSASAASSATARDKSQAWAETAEDVEVETGKFSSLHHKAKSQEAQSASETARDKSQAWAETAEDTEVETGKFSALHHAAKAEGSANAAAAAFDSFDDRYLGAKASDPATDNDGDALLVGALYFNSTTKKMRQWDGSAWADSFATVELQGNATGAIDMAGFSLTVDAVNYDTVDKGTVTSGTVSFDVQAATKQKLTVGGPLTIALTNKPTNDWELEIDLTNGGAFAITFPTVNWLVGDGTTSTVFADMGVTLNPAGANTLIFWGTGTGDVYGRAG